MQLSYTVTRSEHNLFSVNNLVINLKTKFGKQLLYTFTGQALQAPKYLPNLYFTIQSECADNYVLNSSRQHIVKPSH